MKSTKHLCVIMSIGEGGNDLWMCVERVGGVDKRAENASGSVTTVLYLDS